MKNYIILILLVHGVCHQVQSQIDGLPILNRTEFKVGYYGNLIWNNGLSLGAEYIWKEKKVIKERVKSEKIVTNQLLLNGNLGLSTNFTNRTENSFNTYFGLIWRRTGNKRWQLSVELNPLGYYRSILPETYEVVGDEVSKVLLHRRNYYAPSMAIGIGRQYKEKRLLSWYLNFNFGFRTPYNAGTLPMLALQYGFRFNFKKK